jgi:hypothetical protein
MGVRPGQIQPAACDLRVGDDRYLDEMTQLSEQFAELAEALRPIAGETDTMIVPVSLLRRLTNFVERGLTELRGAPVTSLTKFLKAYHGQPYAAGRNV